MKFLNIGLLIILMVIGVKAEENSTETELIPVDIESDDTNSTDLNLESLIAPVATENEEIISTTATTTTKKILRTKTPTTAVPIRGRYNTKTTIPNKNTASSSRGSKKFDYDNEIGTRSYETNVNYDTQRYKFAYETGDGTKRDEDIEIEHVENEADKMVVKGHYSYIAADGFEYIFSYIADERGFRPIITVKKPQSE